MIRLAMILYSLIGTTLAGSFVVVALVAGFDDMQGIVAAAIIGAVLSIPVSVLVAKQITARG